MKTLKELKRKIIENKKEFLKNYKKAKDVFYDENLSTKEKEEYFEDKYTLLIREYITSSRLNNNPNNTIDIINEFIIDIRKLEPHLFGRFDSLENQSDYGEYDSFTIEDFLYEYEYYVFRNDKLTKNDFNDVKKDAIIKYLGINRYNFNCNIVKKMLKGKIDIDVSIELMKDCNI